MPIPRYKLVNLENKSVQRILAAALDQWTGKGYHGASLKDIADAAGVAKSLVHYHFESKEHLLIELQSSYCKKLAFEIEQRLATERHSLGAAFRAMDEVWASLVAQRAHFPFALEVWRAAIGNAAVRERLRAFDREISALFHEGVLTILGPLAGSLRIPPKRLAEVLHAGLDGIQMRLFILGDVEHAKKIYDDWKLMVRLALFNNGGNT